MKTAIIAFVLTILAEIVLLSVTGANVGPGELIIMLAVAIGVAIFVSRRRTLRTR